MRSYTVLANVVVTGAGGSTTVVIPAASGTEVAFAGASFDFGIT